MHSPNELKVTLVQQNIIWENKPQNLLNLDKLISTVDNTDLIILPELFTTGFTMNIRPLSEGMDGETVSWMKETAKNNDCHILGSAIVKIEQSYYNRLLVAAPDGEIFTYDKRHLFGMGDEDKFYTAGKERLLFNTKEWAICPLVCYDIRFPVWSRNDCGYDLLIYIANWPAVRQNVWENLLISRAIENQCYSIGVNRVGTDGNNIGYVGGSCVIDAKGKKKFLAPDNEEYVSTIKLDKKELFDFREKFPVLTDRDNFSIDK